LEKKILTRVGYPGAVAPYRAGYGPAETDTRIDNVLTRDNLRLQMLRDMYDNCESPVLAHSQWRREFAERLPLGCFRGESSYMWQIADGNVPIHYVATYYYLKNAFSDDLLTACVEDHAFGVQGIDIGSDFVTRDRLDSVCEIGFLRGVFGLRKSSELTVLDIGSGYGRLAWRLSQCYPKANIICADAIAESSFLCEFYLDYRQASRRVRMVPLPHLRSELSKSSVDLAVAVNSLTECTATAVEWWLDLLCESNVPYLFIVPHAAFKEGMHISTCEVKGSERKDIIPLLESRGFRRRIFCPKYAEPAMQKYGVSPTYYHLFERVTKD